jgi:hypothetical protein
MADTSVADPGYLFRIPDPFPSLMQTQQKRGGGKIRNSLQFKF